MSTNDSHEFRQFDLLSRKVLAVSKAEILRREAEYQNEAAKNSNRRGPKRKTKPSASPSLASS